MTTGTPDGGGYDAASKAAVHAGLPGLLRLLGIHVAGRRGPGGTSPELQPLPVDLPAMVHRADLLYRLPDQGLLHIEIQQKPDPVMGRRMVDYAIRLAAAHPALLGRSAAIQLVIQVTGPPMPTKYVWAGVTGEFRLLHIPSTDPADLLSTPALAPFALVPGGKAAVPAVARHIAATRDTQLQWTLATLAVRLAPHLAAILVEQLRENAVSTEIIVRELLKTDVGKKVFDELYPGVRGESHADSRAKGRAEGRAEGLRAALVTVLSHRFPDADSARLDRTAGRLSNAASDASDAVDAAFAVDELDA